MLFSISGVQGMGEKMLLRHAVEPISDSADLVQTLHLALYTQLLEAGAAPNDDQICTQFKLLGRQLAYHIVLVLPPSMLFALAPRQPGAWPWIHPMVQHYGRSVACSDVLGICIS